jgi:hypothetical protein
MLNSFSLPVLPTFESFIVRRTDEVAPLDAKQGSALLKEDLDSRNAARLNITQRYPDDSETAIESLFEWNCC